MEYIDRLCDFLHPYYPHLKSLSRAKQRFLCWLALNIFKGTNPHWIYKDAGVCCSRKRNRAFNTATAFNRANSALGWFVIGDRFSVQGGFARPAWIKDQTLSKLIGVFIRREQITPHTLTDHNGNPFTSKTKAIISRDSNENNRVTKCQLNSPLRVVDINALLLLREKFAKPEDYKKQVITDLLIHAANPIGYEPGTLMIQYREGEDSRIHGIGLNPQNLDREITRAAFNGQWDHDINQAHPTIMLGLCRKHGVTGLDSLEHITQHKEEFRQGVCDRTGADYSQVKRGINALAYGANLSTSKACSLYGILFEFTPDFIGDPEIRALHKDFRMARKMIMEKEARYSRKRLMNAVNKPREIKEKDPGNKCAVSHIVTGYESLATQMAIEATNGEITLLMHDGFIAPEPINTAPIEQRFLAETGIPITYSVEQLKTAA